MMPRLSLFSSLIYLLLSFATALPFLTTTETIHSTLTALTLDPRYDEHYDNDKRIFDSSSSTSSQDSQTSGQHLLPHSSVSAEAETSPAIAATENDQSLQLSDILSIAHSELRRRDVADIEKRQVSNVREPQRKRGIGHARKVQLGGRAYTVMTSNMYIESAENDEDMKLLLDKEKRNVEVYKGNNLANRGIRLRSDIRNDVFSASLSGRQLGQSRSHSENELSKKSDITPQHNEDEEERLEDKKERDDDNKTPPAMSPPPTPFTSSSSTTGLSTSNIQNGLAVNGTCSAMIVVFAKGSFEKGNVGNIAGPPFFASLAAVMGES